MDLDLISIDVLDTRSSRNIVVDRYGYGWVSESELQRAEGYVKAPQTRQHCYSFGLRKQELWGLGSRWDMRTVNLALFWLHRLIRGSAMHLSCIHKIKEQTLVELHFLMSTQRAYSFQVFISVRLTFSNS